MEESSAYLVRLPLGAQRDASILLNISIGGEIFYSTPVVIRRVDELCVSGDIPWLAVAWALTCLPRDSGGQVNLEYGVPELLPRKADTPLTCWVDLVLTPRTSTKQDFMNLAN